MVYNKRGSNIVFIAIKSKDVTKDIWTFVQKKIISCAQVNDTSIFGRYTTNKQSLIKAYHGQNKPSGESRKVINV